MRFGLMVTGPAYGTQQSSSALQFSKALITSGYQLKSVFFYREGVYNANRFIFPTADEFDLKKSWRLIKIQHDVELHVCISASLRRGIIDSIEATRFKISGFNLEDDFLFSGLGELAQTTLSCDRVVQF